MYGLFGAKGGGQAQHGAFSSSKTLAEPAECGTRGSISEAMPADEFAGNRNRSKPRLQPP